MACRAVHSREGAAAFAAAPPLDDPDQLAADLARLEELDLHGLRARWRRLFRKPAPPHLPRYLLLRIIAYRVQVNALGDLDRDTARLLDQIARERSEGRSTRIPPAPDRRGLKPGTLLIREHDGVLHRVTVVKGGFGWNGTTCRSLSEVARAITGTRWSGPRFFGLREQEKEEPV
jgi:hypothetical protein